ncbi:MAG: hypothetical protein QOJ86_3101 [Bradyrhizobium sp.]|nr:hypothetical protein [Bradyrhizobium sp.]
MSATIYKNFRSQPIKAVGGEGAWIIGSDGQRYLDACGGVCVSSLGHRHPRIVDAIARHADMLTWAHAGSFTTEPAEELAQFLVERSGGLAKAQFLSGGSEAMELALKIAYQYHWERGATARTLVVSRRQSYHGSTFGTLSISGNEQRRSIFEPFLRESLFVSPCYAYREKEAGETDDEYSTRLADELNAQIERVGPEHVAAFVAEPVVGSTNGAVPAVPDYFRKIQRVCDRHQVLLILDDVMSGMGRTGFLFAHLEDGVRPDIVAIGKGLAAGYQPISAVLVSSHVLEAIEAGSGDLKNGQTHVNHPFACAVALEVQRTLQDQGLVDQARRRGDLMRKALVEQLEGFDFVGDVRGRGLFLGVELVASRRTKAPLSGGTALSALLKRAALERKLLIYPGAGTAGGQLGNHVLFAPPFVASEDEILEMVRRFASVLAACRREIEALATGSRAA